MNLGGFYSETFFWAVSEELISLAHMVVVKGYCDSASVEGRVQTS